MIDALVSNNKRAILFLLLLSGIFFIGLGNVHLFDWDEVNFAESAREMMASGDYLRVQINFEPFWEKPPFFFWLQVAAMKIFGINEFAARFPNALFGFIYLVSLYFIGKKHFGARFGMIWSLLFFATLLPHIYFKTGIIDPVFNYFIFMSIYFMMLVVSGDHDNKGRLALISGVFSGLSVITKGPVGFLLLGLTLLVYLIVKRFKPFPKLKHILLFFVGLLSILFIWLSIEFYNNGFTIIQKFIEYQAELFSSDVAGHAQPFYYHFVVVFFGCFPASILALPSLIKKRKLPFDFHTWMLCLFWVVLILFSIVTTKIIHYSSMTWVPLSFIAAITLYRYTEEKIDFSKGLRISYLITGIFVGLAMIAVPLAFMNKDFIINSTTDQYVIDSVNQNIPWSGVEIAGGIVFIVGVILAFVFLRRQQMQQFILTSVISTSITLLIVQFLVIPKVEQTTQGPAIAFFKEKKNEDCYIECYGHHSYAQYFYSQQPFGLSEEQRSTNWLFHGPIDKPVYVITKSSYKEVDKMPQFKLIEHQGGFYFYKREPQSPAE